MSAMRLCLPPPAQSSPGRRLQPRTLDVCPAAGVFTERENRAMAVRIGELLLKEKRITPAQLQDALNYQKTNGGKLGFNLVKLGIVKDEEITSLLSKQYGVPSINLAQFDIDPAVIKLIPAETAQK